MANSSISSPVFLKNYRPILLAFLFFLLQIFFPLVPHEAAAKQKYPKGYSVKSLDLSRQLTVEDLMAAGQLGGTLHPTRDMADKAKELAVNASFGQAIQAWNKHEYREAVELFRAHVAQYPDSPWAAESLLHLGCDALFHGRYSEAEPSFQWILRENQGNKNPGAQMMVHKTRVRLANLKTAQGNFPEALEHYRILKQTSPDWRHRTYAAHWIQRLSLEKQHQAAVFNCGTQALAHLLKKSGKKAAAAKVLALQASSPRGQSMKELQLIAAGHGYRLTGLRLAPAQLQKLPLPAIVQISGTNQGDLGHYWVLEKTGKDILNFYDPQSRRRFHQTPAEFAREWGGHALVFARKQKLPGVLLAAREMANL
jgi:tetratricopeptide (TPR) repeat protein